jgi:hypothetical protein
VADNVRGESCAHAIALSELNGKHTARTFECVAHEPQSIGVIDAPDAARWSHFRTIVIGAAVEEGAFALNSQQIARPSRPLLGFCRDRVSANSSGADTSPNIHGKKLVFSSLNRVFLGNRAALQQPINVRRASWETVGWRLVKPCFVIGRRPGS